MKVLVTGGARSGQSTFAEKYVFLLLPKSFSCRQIFITISFYKTIHAQFIQIGPGIIPFRHLILRQFGNAELDFHITTLGNFMSIFQCLKGIWKNLSHLLWRFHIILTAFVTHTVFICYFFKIFKVFTKKVYPLFFLIFKPIFYFCPSIVVYYFP